MQNSKLKVKNWGGRLSLYFCIFNFAFLIAASACRFKPTYKASEIANELKKMCSHDYQMSVETRHVGNNLQAFFWRVGLLQPSQLEMKPEAAESLERVLLCATRISLSTDAPLQFLEVKMMDALTGATVTLWRLDRKSTRLNSSHLKLSRMPSSA